MVDNNRRKILKASSAAVGLSAIPSISAASHKSQTEDEITINDRTVLSETENKVVTAIDISNEKENRTDRKRFITIVDKESGSVSMTKAGAEQYESLTDDPEVTASGTEVATSSNGVTIAAEDEIVERSDVYAHAKGSCALYDGHTHQWAAVTAKFVDQIGDLSWGAISAALISLIGSSALSAGASAILSAAVATVGGIAAYVTDTYALTFGAEEWDKSFFHGSYAMYSARVAPGYHKSEGELTTISAFQTHPSR